MKGLHADHAGANPMVHLGLVESSSLDPHCWAVMQTLRFVRDCGEPSRVEAVLAQMVDGSDKFPSNSITHTLLTRLQCVGWHVGPNGHVHDMFGSFSLFAVSAAELAYRVSCHWTYVVAAATSHRPCFAGLELCDADDTRKWVASLEVSDRALFRLVLNGSHVTQDGKKYCSEVSTDQCPFCLCSDSRYHRFWECPQFEHLRLDIGEERRLQILHSPEALTCAGWSLAPSTQIEWNQYFASLTVPVLQPRSFTGDVHFFTDGSCQNQSMPECRFAGWAVIQAAVTSLTDFSATQIADSGVLPGLLQSAVRAEIYAVWRALLLSRKHPAVVYIWSDCDAVVKRCRRIWAGHEVKVNSLHADLWVEIQQCLRDRFGPTVFTHVSAHQTQDAAPTVVAEWCFHHNNLADKQAMHANNCRSRVFWDCVTAMCRP